MSHKDHHRELEPIGEQIKEEIRTKRNWEFWRSLEELAGTERFREFLQREFPALNASVADPSMLDPAGRRNFLKLMSASLAFAGLTACTRQPQEHIVPYVKTPDGLVPGKPQFYATAMTLGGVATGLLVQSYEGRPTKIEGNPEHPGSLGGTTAYDQASVLQLYDPDRSQTALKIGDPRTWGDFLNELRDAVEGQRTKQGAGLRILTETITSPTLADQMKKLLAAFPQAKWHVYEPWTRDGARLGGQLAFGQFVNTVYRFDQADVVLSLDADFLCSGPGSVRYARDFMGRRKLAGGAQEMNRLYVVESTMTTTGAKADHRRPMKASAVAGFGLAVANALGVSAPAGERPSDEVAKFAEAVAKDLKAHSGKSIVIAGEHQPPAVHALAHAINHALGNIGQTVVITDSIDANPVDQIASITQLVNDMNAGQVDLLVILDANPVYNAPHDLKFLDAMNKVTKRVHMGLYNDETAVHCQWHVAGTHYLESWSDARAFDGTVSIIQPLIEPLYNGRSPHELLAAMTNQVGKSSYDLVRDYWKTQLGANFEQVWKQSLHDGVIANSALPAKTVALSQGWAAAVKPAPAAKYEIVFRPDPCVHDGRFANNSWLQETPKPLSKVTWDNYAIVSTKTGRELGLAPENEWHQTTARVLRLFHGENYDLYIPAWVQAGHPDDTVTVYLGYGRDRAGSVGNGLGYNTYELRTSKAPSIATEGVRFETTSNTQQLASTQEHFNIDASEITGYAGFGEGAFLNPEDDLAARHIVRVADLEDYKKDPKIMHHGAHNPGKELTMYQPWEYHGYAWGMTVDLNSCIGCNACLVACQSENNIPVVGKELVLKGRIMHWLRIDTYFKGDKANPEVYFQPMMCQHCENAPCEVVCPVNATVHDAEGLNVQVYNRCVGTRYCSNNCPYKVRRFNYLLYGDFDTPVLKNVRNPEVTVRTRGVMEKCTFCVQRIMTAKIEAEKQDRKVQDGDILTACQSACPTEGIIFGDINNPESRVAKMKKEPRTYEVLADLNTRPRTSYLAAIRNPNPELESGGHGSGHDGQQSGEVKQHG
ncbi:MAG TPA: TAT-variant-translocated molybdopterin oxidoreductase [Blastocatellia bacterium]|nr:TAT-variant-translocated molybdopterin oxidoreductase [Blastocatellia bacterium]